MLPMLVRSLSWQMDRFCNRTPPFELKKRRRFLLLVLFQGVIASQLAHLCLPATLSTPEPGAGAGGSERPVRRRPPHSPHTSIFCFLSRACLGKPSLARQKLKTNRNKSVLSLSLIRWSCWLMCCGAKNASFCAIVCKLKTIILPRQARDKHKEKLRKRRRSLFAGTAAQAHVTGYYRCARSRR
jgi:hypothetical protein